MSGKRFEWKRKNIFQLSDDAFCRVNSNAKEFFELFIVSHLLTWKLLSHSRASGARLRRSNEMKFIRTALEGAHFISNLAIAPRSPRIAFHFAHSFSSKMEMLSNEKKASAEVERRERKSSSKLTFMRL